MRTITFAAPCIKRYETGEFQPGPEPRFVPVSLTGTDCMLQCDHCRSRLLSGMYNAKSPEQFPALCERLASRGCRGMLITGGCSPDGTVPLAPFAETISKAKHRHGFTLAAHTKLINPAFASAARTAEIDLVMLDLVGDTVALHEVYHLRESGLEDIERSLDLAAEYGLKIAPHIVIGLSEGRVVGEYRALEMLKDRAFEVLVLVVFSPLRNTPLQDAKVDLDSALEFLRHARRFLPDARIALGCAKGSGPAQRAVEREALRLGFDAVAYPSDGIPTEAAGMGYEVRFSEACCAFLPLNRSR